MAAYDPYSQLKETMKDFCQLTHVRISFFDPITLKCIIQSGFPYADYCYRLHEQPELDERCNACDRDALTQAKNMPDTLYCRKCYTGLVDYIYPVYYNKVLLGFFMIGQARPDVEDSVYQQERERIYEQFGMDSRTMHRLYDALPIVNENWMLAAGRFMGSIVQQTFLKSLAGDNNAKLSLRVDLYIRFNYMQPITIDTACDFFKVCRSHLCHTIRKDFGTTFNAMLERQRVECVCRSIIKTTDPAELSSIAGFSSASSMKRTFQKIIGQPLKEYLRSHNSTITTP